MAGQRKRKQQPAEQHQPKKHASPRGRGNAKVDNVPIAPASPAAITGQEEEEEEKEPEKPQRGLGEPSTSYSSSSSSGSSSSEGSSDQEAAEDAEPRRSFADLVAGKLEDEALKSLFRSLPQKRTTERQRLLAGLLAAQPQWLLWLRGGFSLLFYGLGSKKDMLQDFARSALMEIGAVVTVNGYVPSLSASQVVAATATALSGKVAKSCGNTAKDIIDFLHREAAHHAARSCFVIVHNIDGPGLRAESEQALLANLARCPSVHMLASIDHVNAPLLWSKAMESKFRWLWVNATSFAPYIAETMDTPSILAEFTDHRLLAVRRSSEGAGEVLYVPTDTAGLQKISEELEAIKAGA
ncbi:origin recognition complex subunit 2-domain-containing protein [Dunaliella salina]|uniref:Origin recognition complex subunit 2 n=1 Tax=Dunaliella salina TaxID=3046 RepID=A0ABQ7GM03_DUNSA|nr:origin recognition complex subunit 2-domain-containing protein [Dunaliella salina]|eukprot:KAF5835638.1 origin recognition complex subunit 2-domain-containing protein [Dunaliella salina]